MLELSGQKLMYPCNVQIRPLRVKRGAPSVHRAEERILRPRLWQPRLVKEETKSKEEDIFQEASNKRKRWPYVFNENKRDQEKLFKAIRLEIVPKLMSEAEPWI